jgi:hypothetical protein
MHENVKVRLVLKILKERGLNTVPSCYLIKRWCILRTARGKKMRLNIRR